MFRFQILFNAFLSWLRPAIEGEMIDSATLRRALALQGYQGRPQRVGNPELPRWATPNAAMRWRRG